MLKPFQIRNLHLYPAEENLYDSSTESVVSSSHVDETHCRRSDLIHLTAPEYDDILRDHPNAGLTYIDDDDGDIVTVSTYVLTAIHRVYLHSLGWVLVRAQTTP